MGLMMPSRRSMQRSCRLRSCQLPLRKCCKVAPPQAALDSSFEASCPASFPLLPHEISEHQSLLVSSPCRRMGASCTPTCMGPSASTSTVASSPATPPLATPALAGTGTRRCVAPPMRSSTGLRVSIRSEPSQGMPSFGTSKAGRRVPAPFLHASEALIPKATFARTRMALTALSAPSQKQRAAQPLQCRKHLSDASCHHVLSWASRPRRQSMLLRSVAHTAQ